MTFHAKRVHALLAAAALVAAPSAALAHNQAEPHEHAANEADGAVSDKANEVASSARQLQEEANALGATVANTQASEDDAARADGRDDDDDDDDGDEGKWGLLGLLGLAGLLGLKRRDRDDDYVRRTATATTGTTRTTTDRDTRL